MQHGEAANARPQFETADYGPSAGTDECTFCHAQLGSPYHHINGNRGCSACAAQARNVLASDTHAAYVRALLFGASGAAVGLVLYALVSIVTGLMIGYMSLAVGYIVAKAMKKGSGGIGGRRYQIAAVLFTYAAVSMAAIPIGIAQVMRAHKAGSPRIEQERERGAPAVSQAAPKRRIGIVFELAALALFGLASPFLELQDPVSGLIGLVILFVGIQIAWKATAGPSLSVDGPF